ncbi:MAG: helix-turn-helix domain-containing protein [Actinomycetota bacterium]
MAQTDGLSTAKRRIVDALKRRALTGPELAERFDLTPEAVRQHLHSLRTGGLVTSGPRTPTGAGRPPEEWSLTELAQELFPDRHADLTVSLIESLRRAVGEDGLDAVIDARTADQIAEYRATVIDADDPLQALAAIRSDEGYLAEVVDSPDGDGRLLIEHHCPICAAASVCQGLCRSELEVFQATLGANTEVEREQHLLSGDQRCVYRIRPRQS